MFKKALTESGRRILKAIKKLSTKSRAVRKSQEKQRTLINHQVNYELVTTTTTTTAITTTTTSIPGWSPTYMEPDVTSLSWSLPSLDTKSVDTYVTYVMEGLDECNSMCCYCTEHENQRNENKENEMII